MIRKNSMFLPSITKTTFDSKSINQYGFILYKQKLIYFFKSCNTNVLISIYRKRKSDSNVNEQYTFCKVKTTFD